MPGTVPGTEQRLRRGLGSESTNIFTMCPREGKLLGNVSSPRSLSPSLSLSFLLSSLPTLSLQAVSGINVLTFPVDIWPG